MLRQALASALRGFAPIQTDGSVLVHLLWPKPTVRLGTRVPAAPQALVTCFPCYTRSSDVAKIVSSSEFQAGATSERRQSPTTPQVRVVVS